MDIRTLELLKNYNSLEIRLKPLKNIHLSLKGLVMFRYKTAVFFIVVKMILKENKLINILKESG